jgi:gas vesicle protein
MTQTEHPRNGALTLFLAFVGGALIGGTAAVLFAPRSGAETRRRITGAVDETKEVASRMPQAIREASSAAQAAFAASLKDSAGADAAVSTPPGSPPPHRS